MFEYCELRPSLEKGLSLIDQFNELGRDGWDFIFESNGIYYFKRVIVDVHSWAGGLSKDG